VLGYMCKEANNCTHIQESIAVGNTKFTVLYPARMNGCLALPDNPSSQKTNMFDQPFYTHYNVDNNHNWLTCDSACYIVIYAFKTLSYMTNNHRMDLYLVAVAQI